MRWSAFTDIGVRARRACVVVCAALLLAGAATAALSGGDALAIAFFRIGTGSTDGTYFPVGGLLASAISKPPGSRECELGGSCGVSGLIAVAQSTEGSVANVLGVAEGRLESGLSQADISYWAYTGEGIFKEHGPLTDLRTIANLFPETVHLVVSAGSGITSVGELRGKRVSLDREGSGTRVDALLILEAFGLSEKDIDPYAMPVGIAADMLRAGELDAFFMVVGAPATAITDLAQEGRIRLVPINGPEADKLREAYPFFSPDRIPSGTYWNVSTTDTLSVGAQWIISAKVSDELVYGITRALWHDSTRRLLDSGHPKGRLITLDDALKGLVVPLHPGARRYYEENGLEPTDAVGAEREPEKE